MPRYNTADRALMVLAYRESGGLIAAAKEIGCSHNTIRAALLAADVPVKPVGGRRGAYRNETPRWGRRVATNGYVIWFWSCRGQRGEFAEHAVVMSQMLGRSLLPGESVHHRNGIRDDNRPENLELWIAPQPSGIRVEDAISWAHTILDRYSA